MTRHPHSTPPSPSSPPPRGSWLYCSRRCGQPPTTPCWSGIRSRWRPRRPRDRARSPVAFDGHRPGVRARRGERDHLRYRTYLSIGCGTVGVAGGGGDCRGLLRAYRPLSRPGRDPELRARGVARDARLAGARSGNRIRGSGGGGRSRLASRRFRPGAVSVHHAGSRNPGVWVAVGAAPPVLPAGVRHPWVLRNPQSQPGAPPPLHSRRYAATITRRRKSVR